MQMIARITPADQAGWKAEFDGQAENIAAAGLSLLQMWRALDRPGQVVLLFEARDRKRAGDWLAREAGFGRALEAEFLEPAF